MIALRVDTHLGLRHNKSPFLSYECLMNIDHAERRTGNYKGSWRSLAKFWYNMAMDDLDRDWRRLSKKDRLRYDRDEWTTDMRHAERMKAHVLIKKAEEELRKGI